MKNDTGICYLCGKIDKVTDDHCPPHCLSPMSPRGSFTILPSCNTCNGKYSHEENKFCAYVAMGGAGRGNKSADDAQIKSFRNFQRNPIARLFIGPSKDLLRLFNNVKKVRRYSPGGIYLESGYEIAPPEDLNYQAVLEKIGRGLHYIHTNEVVPSDYNISVNFIRHINKFDEINNLKQLGQYGDFFKYRGDWAVDDKKSGIWFMLFYNIILAKVIFRRPNNYQVNQSQNSI